MYSIAVQQVVSPGVYAPATSQVRRFAKKVLQAKIAMATLTIRIVDEPEMTELNLAYRKKPGSTNVLSFPFNLAADLAENLLGDIVICAQVVNREALEQNKIPLAHWAHMVVHGTLHLLGFDHENEADALVMEAEEIAILASLGFSNPYSLNKDNNNA